MKRVLALPLPQSKFRLAVNSQEGACGYVPGDSCPAGPSLARRLNVAAVPLPRLRRISCHRPAGHAPSRAIQRHSHLTRLYCMAVVNLGSDILPPVQLTTQHLSLWHSSPHNRDIYSLSAATTHRPFYCVDIYCTYSDRAAWLTLPLHSSVTQFRQLSHL